MEHINIKRTFLHFTAIVFMLLTVSPVSAQIQKEARLSKQFAANNSTIVDVVSKYSNINVQTWNKDSVAVDIHVIVTEDTEMKAESKLRTIQFDLSQTSDFIVIKVLFQNERKNLFINELSKLKESVGMSDATVEIEMELFVPSNLALQINNKFGNIHLEDFVGDLKIDLSNGKLKANSIKGYGNMRLNFSDAIVGEFGTGKIEVYYGELKLNHSDKLRISSKTSDITIADVADLTINSTRDNYHILSVGHFETQSSFSDYTISEMLQAGKAIVSFGDISINKIAPNFNELFLELKSSNIDLNFTKGSNFNFDITTNKQASLPGDAKVTSKKSITSDDKAFQYLGKIGNSGNEEPRLVIVSQSGSIIITKK